MDINELGTQSETISVMHPTLGDVGITFTVCDPLSSEFANATARLDRSGAGSGVSGFVVTQALCAVVDWQGIEDKKGEIAYTQEKAKELLTDPKFYWMCAAVDEHYGKKKGYMQTLMNRLKHSQS